jgi:hypothetical protein
MVTTSAQTTLDYFRVLVWPVVALVIAVMFREKIRAAIPRVRKFWIFGSGAELDPSSLGLAVADIRQARMDPVTRSPGSLPLET